MSYRIVLTAPDGKQYDVSERVSLDGLSSLTWTVERNLHEFRCSDLTLTLDDGDDFIRDLFSNLGPDDRWRVTVERDGRTYFAGNVPPFDSITFDRGEKTVEITALDLSKLVEETPADSVARSTVDYSITSGSAGSKTLTLTDTSGLFNGDGLALADGANEEDVVIALVKNATQVLLVSALANTYTSAGTATLSTPGYRFQTPDFLVDQLMAAASDIIVGTRVNVTGIPRVGAPILMGQSMNKITSQSFPGAFTQKDGAHYLEIGGVGAWEQTAPDQDWTSVSNVRFADWTPYRSQADGEPSDFCTPPNSSEESSFGYDYTPGAFVAYELFQPTTTTMRLRKYTSADGTTWSGPTTVNDLDVSGSGAGFDEFACDVDATRNRVYYAYLRKTDSSRHFGYWDVAGAAKTELSTSDAINQVRYSKELDMIIAFLSGGGLNVQFWRDATKLHAGHAAKRTDSQFSRTARSLNGWVYFVEFQKNVPKLHYSDDFFATETVIDLTPAVSVTNNCRLTIVNGTVRVVCIGAPSNFWYLFVVGHVDQWRVDYADFIGKNVANSLDDLAILMNAVFYVDHAGIGYFVHRSLDSGNGPYLLPITGDLEPSVLEEVPLWLETYSYVEVTLGGTGKGTAGVKTSKSRNLSVQVEIDGPDALAGSIAEFLLSFFAKRRSAVHVEGPDDGAEHVLLDTVRFDGRDWLLYGLERDLGQYVRSMDLIEKVA